MTGEPSWPFESVGHAVRVHGAGLEVVHQFDNYNPRLRLSGLPPCHGLPGGRLRGDWRWRIVRADLLGPHSNHAPASSVYTNDDMLAMIFALACGSFTLIDPPPLHIVIAARANIPVALVQQMVKEADAVWRDGGITFVWHTADHDHPPADLYITVDDAHRPPHTTAPALGWITLNDQLLPTRFLHASYGNVLAMLETMGNPMSMPPAQVQTYLARGFGRVLAHELGHYLLASNAHAKRGLMQASLSPEMLFGPGRATLKMPTTVCDALHN